MLDSLKQKLLLRYPGNARSIIRDLLQSSATFISRFNPSVILESYNDVRNLMKRLITVVLVFGSLVSVSAVEAENEVLSITSPWIREAPPGVPTLAAYMDITNSSASPIVIMGVSSEIAKRTEMHEVKMENDMMQMRKMSEVILNQGETLELKAGGSHIMLMGVQESFKEGDEIEIEFKIKGHPVTRIMVPVKKEI